MKKKILSDIFLLVMVVTIFYHFRNLFSGMRCHFVGKQYFEDCFGQILHQDMSVKYGARETRQ